MTINTAEKTNLELLDTYTNRMEIICHHAEVFKTRNGIDDKCSLDFINYCCNQLNEELTFEEIIGIEDFYASIEPVIKDIAEKYEFTEKNCDTAFAFYTPQDCIAYFAYRCANNPEDYDEPSICEDLDVILDRNGVPVPTNADEESVTTKYNKYTKVRVGFVCPLGEDTKWIEGRIKERFGKGAKNSKARWSRCRLVGINITKLTTQYFGFFDLSINPTKDYTEESIEKAIRNRFGKDAIYMVDADNEFEIKYIHVWS